MPRLRTSIFALLLLVIPWVGMAAFVPEEPPCPMHQQNPQGPKPAPMKCCGELGMPSQCQADHCNHCNIAPSLLSVEIASGAEPVFFNSASTLTNLRNGHDPTGLWRPPRFV